MEVRNMMQGDAYSLAVKILNGNKEVVKPADVRDVEICVGSLRKTYGQGEVTYDADSQKWKFPLTQEETFKMLPAKVKSQVRVVWSSGDVEGYDLGYIRFNESISKEVL